MKSILLIGLNHFGTLLAKRLHDLGHEIMAVDKNESRINDILPLVTNAEIGDSTNEAFLRSLGIDGYDVCFVTIGGDFQSSLETTSMLKELGGRLVIARADRAVQAKFLLRNGADGVIEPEKQIAEWAAIRYASNHVLDYIKLDDEYSIYEVPIPREWTGKSIGQIDIRKKYGLNIMALKEGGKLILSITPETILSASRTLLVLGHQNAIQKCFHTLK